MAGHGGCNTDRNLRHVHPSFYDVLPDIVCFSMEFEMCADQGTDSSANKMDDCLMDLRFEKNTRTVNKLLKLTIFDLELYFEKMNLFIV